ncbi:hypothetical protein [Streptomyces sp. NPDC050355]|uniref:hypothetical protein n=1 Tax=Streptomyces sp. NPDC050355 TaxID=3365609 RepID=UPI0037A1E790
MSTEITAYEHRYLGMLDDLKGAQGINVLHHKSGRVVTAYGEAPEVFDKLSRRNYVTLDTASPDHFLRFRNLACLWETTAPHPGLTGEFGLSHLYASISGGPLDIAEQFSSSDDRELASEMRLIDDHPEGGGGSFAAMRVRGNANPPEIWYFTVAHGFKQLDIDYNKYLDTLLITKGTYGWQYLFADISLRDEEFLHARKRLTTMLIVLPDLFPDHDYQHLRELLEQRL